MKRGVKRVWGKLKLYAWRLIYLVLLGVGLYLIGRPVISIIRTSIDIKELKEEKARYQASIERDSLFLENLKSPEFLEQYARETYYMQRPDEQVFIVEE